MSLGPEEERRRRRLAALGYIVFVPFLIVLGLYLLGLILGVRNHVIPD